MYLSLVLVSDMFFLLAFSIEIVVCAEQLFEIHKSFIHIDHVFEA